jgi:hypothetical protein
MKFPRLFCFCLVLASTASAQDTFPGLNAILSDAEKKRAGLSRLSPDEVGVIDAALIRYYMRVITGLNGIPPAPPPAATPPPEPTLRERLSLPNLTNSDWRTQPPLLARCTSWQGANRFVLDNGQVWEGLDPIPFELPGKPVIIEARPNGAFALKLDDKSAIVRVRRLK